MAAELEVIIGANTKGIEDGANRAERALKGVQQGITRLQNEIKDNITISKGYASAIQDLTRAFKAGDISQKDYSNGIRRLQRDEKETGLETKRLTAELRNLQREQKQLSVGLDGGANSLNKFGKETKANAMPAMQEFSRVIQDAPFGIMGVGNNIQQLTANFGNLSKQAGGTSAALRLMLGTLTGPAGILLAVSAVTTLLTVYGDELLSLVGSTNKLSDATKKYVGEAMAEASELKILVEIASSHESSIVARRKAIQEINSKYGEYLGNIDEESIKTDKVKNSIVELTKALIQQAQIKGLKDLIGEETLKAAEKLTGLQITQRELYKDIQKELKEMDKTGFWSSVIHDSKDVIGSLEKIAKTGEKVPSGLATAVGGYKEITKQINDIGKETAKAIEPFQDLQRALTEKVFGITVVPEFDAEEIVIKSKKDKGNKDKLAEIKALRKAEQDSYDHLMDYKLGQEAAFMSELKSMYGEFGAENFLEGIDTAHFQILEFEKAVKSLKSILGETFDGSGYDLQGLIDLKDRLTETQETAEIFASSVGGAISEMGGLIQEKFAESGRATQIFAGLIFNTMTKILSQLVQQLITEKIIGAATKKVEYGKSAAKGVTIATNAAAAAGPVGIGLLPGFLAATQAMIASSFAAISAFNFGGFVGDNNLVRMNGDERVLTATQANRIDRIAMGQSVGMGGQRITVDMNAVFVQRGNDLVATVNQTQQVQSRRG